MFQSHRVTFPSICSWHVKSYVMLKSVNNTVSSINCIIYSWKTMPEYWTVLIVAITTSVCCYDSPSQHKCICLSELRFGRLKHKMRLRCLSLNHFTCEGEWCATGNRWWVKFPKKRTQEVCYETWLCLCEEHFDCDHAPSSHYHCLDVHRMMPGRAICWIYAM